MVPCPFCFCNMFNGRFFVSCFDTYNDGCELDVVSHALNITKPQKKEDRKQKERRKKERGRKERKKERKKKDRKKDK